MELDLTEKALEDIKYFSRTGQKNILKKIEILLSEIEVNPFIGTGKPEQLKHKNSAVWSRRINREHRIIYEEIKKTIIIHSLKGHY